VVIDLDGGVRAIVGGRDYGESQFNRATDALRQPGSSFKPYVYAAALAHGFKPTSVVVDAPICLGNWCPHNYSGGYRGAMTLTQALTASINTIAVRLSVQIGNGNARAGRNKIVEIAKKMGIRTPLPDTPSLPIGADAVTVLEHTAAYAAFANEGKAVAAHTVLEVRTAAGEIVWRFDRDGPKPVAALSPQVARDMNAMMHNVTEAGTARRARLEGVPASGKTGTTNAYRDAWFVGYTGNFVAGIWFGNDDYTPMNRMTGGSIPAQTWHQIMAYAHQGIEIKPIPGVPEVPVRKQPLPESVATGSTVPARPPSLTRAGAEALVRIERLLEEAARALAVSDRTTPAPRAERAPPRREAFAAAR
jgi:penicillin-binding protein 1A